MNIEIFPIFPIPVLKSNIGREFSKEEIDFVLSYEQKVVEGPFVIHIGNSGTVDKKILDHPEMSNIKKILEECLNEWCNKIYAPSYPNDFKLKITQSWINYTKPGEYHDPHYHPNSIVSGSLYISANKEHDIITFTSDKKKMVYIESKELNIFNSLTDSFQVGKGDIILFPSEITHSVPTTKTNYTRVSLAFNSFIEGKIGMADDSGTLSDLPNYIEFNNIK